MNFKLKKMFRNIKSMCEKLDEVDGSIFAEPAIEKELDVWEEENGIKIPKIYRSWLQISKYINVCGGLVQLFMPSINGYYGSFVPNDYVVIGNMIGDGERICFMRMTGEFVRYDHGHVIRINGFEDILLWLMEYLEIIMKMGKGNIRHVKKNEMLRRQAVQEFWIHERELLSNGECTRNWTFDEIECIYNISPVTGNKRTYAGKPIVFGNDGKMCVDENGTPVYYEGHHMLSYAEHPEFIGNWKNIQALTPVEHMNGAHGVRQ